MDIVTSALLKPPALRGRLDLPDKIPEVTPITPRQTIIIFLQISSFVICSKILFRHLGRDRVLDT